MINQYFGFSENPFNATPDPRYLFLTESHQEALASMIYGIREKKGFVCISGEIGTGKTTLIRHLLNTLDPNVKTVFIYQTLVSFEELLKEIVLELELPLGDQSKTYLTRQLNNYLIQRFSQDETLVLFIDEAQHLGQEVLEGLRLLSNLETERAKLLQMVLVGQVELEKKLSAPELRQFKQRIGIWRRLKPLTEQESREYIQHRLKTAGGTLDGVLTPEAVSMVCRYAEGIPRTINILCDNAFLIGYALSKKKIDAKIVEEVLVDMNLLSKGKKASQGAGDETFFKGDQAGSAAVGHPLSLPGGQGPVTACVTPGEKGTPANHESDHLLARSSSGAQAGHKRPLVAALLVVGLFLAGFYARETLPRFQTTPFPPPAPVASVQANPVDPAQSEIRIRKTITVERGDTISSLAQKYYGLANLTVIDQILTVNQEITNPHYIRERQTIKLPEITEDSWVVQAGDETYRIWLETFPDAKGVEALKKAPSLKGKNIDTLPRPVSSQETWYRAVTGDFKTREACLTAIHGLKLKGALVNL